MNYLRVCMKIAEIINKHYAEFRSMVRNTDRVVEQGKTYEDILQDAFLTCLKKKKDFTDEEGFEYVKRTILMEFKFAPKRKDRDILTFDDEFQDV